MKEPEQAKTGRKPTGRPKGSKTKTGNRTRAKRPQQQPQLEPGENTKYLSHDLRLHQLPHINVNDDKQVSARVDDYFRICAEDDVKPSVASFGLAFHVSRFVLFNWINGRDKTITNTQSVLTLKSAYDLINSYYEHMMNNGKINPVSGIFLMKNNLGYKDTTDYVISANNEHNLTTGDIAERAGLLNE